MCARLCAQMQHTIEIPTHIERAHNMPCHHHHQDTYQQERDHLHTTKTKSTIQMPPQHRQIPRKHSMTHAHKPSRHTCAVETEALQGYQHITGAPPKRHQITADTPLIHHPVTKTQHQTTRHNIMANPICREYAQVYVATGTANLLSVTCLLPPEKRCIGTQRRRRVSSSYILSNSQTIWVRLVSD